jgi:PTH1 family peptidyl-tRNA hydrolase
MKLIVGLGNPGTQYTRSRHNMGFMCVSYFGKKHGIEFDKKQNEARTGQGVIEGIPVVLARPQTFMNNSGQSVSPLMNKFGVNIADLLVIYDDLDLPLGRIRLRMDGSAGGHNGIKSIIAHLGTKDFARLRIGIGRPTAPVGNTWGERDIIDYVLREFAPEERQPIEEAITKASEAILSFIIEGGEKAMNKFNQTSTPPKSETTNKGRD